MTKHHLQVKAQQLKHSWTKPTFPMYHQQQHTCQCHLGKLTHHSHRWRRQTYCLEYKQRRLFSFWPLDSCLSIHHFELNIYSPDHDTFDIMKNIDIQVAPDNFEIAQVDYHPRGYGRVVTFQADLKKAYFGTKYPAKRSGFSN